MERSGILFIFVGPSGCGKTTMVSHLCDTVPGVFSSVSATTRQPREGEKQGEAYFFLSQEEFRQRRDQGEFFECEEVHGNFYGTLKSAVVDSLAQQRDLLLAIDIRGALNIKQALPQETVLVFIVPPSIEEAVRRVTARQAISEDELQRRLSTAKMEYATFFEIIKEQQGLFDYLLINDDWNTTRSEVEAIVVSERLKVSRFNPDHIERKFAAI
jgi:guanylate kinase